MCVSVCEGGNSHYIVFSSGRNKREARWHIQNIETSHWHSGVKGGLGGSRKIYGFRGGVAGIAERQRNGSKRVAVIISR